MDKNALISIIIPVFNSEQYLERCIKSVCTQTYKNIEIILVDDGSTDKSGEICERIASEDKRIIVIHKENGGQASARNTGLDIATGDYIGFVDNDDVIDERMYEVLIKNISIFNVSISAIISDWIYDDRVIIPNGAFPSGIYSGKELLINMFYKEGMISSSVWDKLFKKELFENVRFPFGCEFEDYWVLSQMLPHVNGIYIDTIPMYHWYQYSTSRSKSGFHHKSKTYISIPKKIVQSYENNKVDKELLDAARYFLVLGYIRYFGKAFYSNKKIDDEDRTYQKELRNLVRDKSVLIKSRTVLWKCKLLSSIMIYPYSLLWRIKNI